MRKYYHGTEYCCATNTTRNATNGSLALLFEFPSVDCGSPNQQQFLSVFGLGLRTTRPAKDGDKMLPNQMKDVACLMVFSWRSHSLGTRTHMIPGILHGGNRKSLVRQSNRAMKPAHMSTPRLIGAAKLRFPKNRKNSLCKAYV